MKKSIYYFHIILLIVLCLASISDPSTEQRENEMKKQLDKFDTDYESAN